MEGSYVVVSYIGRQSIPIHGEKEVLYIHRAPGYTRSDGFELSHKQPSRYTGFSSLCYNYLSHYFPMGRITGIGDFKHTSLISKELRLTVIRVTCERNGVTIAGLFQGTKFLQFS